jgi:hypothetical protein
MRPAPIAGWQNKAQNRVCCPGHDQTDYTRRARHREKAETRQLAAEAVADRSARPEHEDGTDAHTEPDRHRNPRHIRDRGNRSGHACRGSTV